MSEQEHLNDLMDDSAGTQDTVPSSVTVSESTDDDQDAQFLNDLMDDEGDITSGANRTDSVDDSADGDAGADGVSDDESPDDIVSSDPDDELLERAVAAGVTLAEARTFDSDQLEIFVGKLEDRAEAGKPEQTETHTLDFDPKAAIQAAKEALGDSADLVDPEVMDMMENVVASLKASFDGKLAEITKGMEAKDQFSADERFNSMIEKMGPEYEKFLGNGKSVSPRSTAGRNRKAIKDEMRVITAGRKASNMPALSEADLFAKATAIVLKDEQQAIARKALTKKVDRRAKSSLRRPGGSDRKDTLTDKDRATNAIKDKMASMGLDPRGADRDIDELLPA